MKLNEWDYLLKSISGSNTLPLTSRCNLSCIFCSNKQNSGFPVLRVKERTVDELMVACEFIDPVKPLVIGESATRYFEGEPFLYLSIFELLEKLRNKYPEMHIKITTNGELLTEKSLQILSNIGNISLTVSINCIDFEERARYLKGTRPGRSILALLDTENIDYTVSAVIFPRVFENMGEEKESIFQLLECMEKYRKTVRIFFAGLSSESMNRFKITVSQFDKIQHEISSKINVYRKDCGFPIIMEPYYIEDFAAYVEGVENSTGRIQPGDIIKAVNGKNVICGTEVIKNYIDSEANYISIQTKDGVLVDQIFLSDDEKPIIRPGVSNRMLKWIDEYVETEPETVIFVSRFAEKAFKKRYNNVFVPENRTFGGNIYCYGLFSFMDIYETLKKIEKEFGKSVKAIVNPAIMDSQGFDITGKTIFDHPGLTEKIIMPPEM